MDNWKDGEDSKMYKAPKVERDKRKKCGQMDHGNKLKVQTGEGHNNWMRDCDHKVLPLKDHMNQPEVPRPDSNWQQ